LIACPNKFSAQESPPSNPEGYSSLPNPRSNGLYNSVSTALKVSGNRFCASVNPLTPNATKGAFLNAPLPIDVIGLPNPVGDCGVVISVDSTSGSISCPTGRLPIPWS